jgi:hypothetical protein
MGHLLSGSTPAFTGFAVPMWTSGSDWSPKRELEMKETNSLMAAEINPTK